MPTVWIPSLLRPLCDGHETVRLPGATVGQVLEAFVAAYPAVEERLFEDGKLRPGMSVAVDGDVSRHNLNHPVREDSELSIIPAIAGGS